MISFLPRPRPFFTTAVLCTIFGLHSLAAARDGSIEDLKTQLRQIDSELETLAEMSMRSGIGTVGYRSTLYDTPDNPEWVQVDFEAEVTIDQVVLVPTIWRDHQKGFQADAFPEAFKILVGTAFDTNGTVVASFDARDPLLPRVAPLSIDLSPVSASWLRIEASVLSRRGWSDGKYLLQLSEILVFSGEENVALHRPVHMSSLGQVGRPRIASTVVDGFTPYLMNAATGRQSVPFISNGQPRETYAITLDLGAAYPINRIHLHTPELSDTIPQATVPGYGIPRHLEITGALESSVQDSTPILNLHLYDAFDSGPILIQRFPTVTTRYLQLTSYNSDLSGGPRVGFAEVEVFSEGNNVALHRTVTSDLQIGSDRSFSSVTDGRNMYGDILPTREWLRQLSRRHDLERMRPLLTQKLDQLYDGQRDVLTLFTWLTVILVIGIAFTIFLSRMLRARELTGIRERFAADLHDELGANIHTIGLLNEIALSSMETPDRLQRVLQESRELTQRTGTAVRHCINLQRANGLYDSLGNNMRKAAQRILVDLPHDMAIQGETLLLSLTPRMKTDLFLFYKECLTNISRHADATEFTTRLEASTHRIELRVSDNGQGISEIPSSLRTRARMLKGNLISSPPQNGGTCIILQLKPRFQHVQQTNPPKDHPSV